MTASEFALLKRTSVVTLSIAGIFKEVVTISAAALVFGDTMTPINIVGLVVTIAAIAAYNYLKITKMRQEAQTTIHREHVQAVSADRFPSSSSSSPVRRGSIDGNSDAEGDDAEDVGLLRQGGAGDVNEAPPPIPRPTSADAERRGRV
jgi:solute carrier family 35, member C2